MDKEMILLGPRARITLNLENNTAVKTQSHQSLHKSDGGFVLGQGGSLNKNALSQLATLLYSSSQLTSSIQFKYGLVVTK